MRQLGGILSSTQQESLVSAPLAGTDPAAWLLCTRSPPEAKLTAEHRGFNFRHIHGARHVWTRCHLQVPRDAGEDVQMLRPGGFQWKLQHPEREAAHLSPQQELRGQLPMGLTGKGL